jgi:hypothetical protein
MEKELNVFVVNIKNWYIKEVHENQLHACSLTRCGNINMDIINAKLNESVNKTNP